MPRCCNFVGREDERAVRFQRPRAARDVLVVRHPALDRVHRAVRLPRYDLRLHRHAGPLSALLLDRGGAGRKAYPRSRQISPLAARRARSGVRAAVAVHRARPAARPAARESIRGRPARGRLRLSEGGDQPAMSAIVNDVTWLNPVEVFAIATPTSVEEVQEAMRGTNKGVSVGGGHFSMGGTTASKGSLHLDMRKLNRVLGFSPEKKTIHVQSGIRWCDIQKFVDPHGLAVKIMQTYANFTVGGSISVNVHGRYIGLGPLVMSLRWIKLVLANGELLEASRTQNPEVFYAVVGGYGALGVIVEAELDLADNTRIERKQVKLAASDYWRYFKENVRATPGVVFHNADLYAPHYTTARAVSWIETKRPVTTRYDLQPHRRNYPLENYFLWAVTETPFGKWRREFLIDPVLYLFPKVHWRNYEAGYDVAELEPPSRKHRTYVLQEYFVPVERFGECVPMMAEILN